MDNILNFVSKLSFFQGLHQEQLKEIAAISVKQNFSYGENLFLQGDRGEGFYVVFTGSVKIYKGTSDGKEVIIHICGPGDQFGQVAMYAGRTFPASAQAITDCQVLFFPRDKFTCLIAKNPSLAMSMLSILSMRIRQVTSQLESIALKEVPGRLAAYLIYLIHKQNNASTVKLSISRTELSSFLGTTPETLSRILARLEKEGLIAIDRRDITISNPEDLEELAIHGRL